MERGSWSCRRCRSKVCDDGDLEQHHQGQRQSSCTSLFLSEPLAWMTDMSEYEGRLSCPNDKCGAKLGSWSWGGAQCSCGAWITPSIQLVVSKLDRHGPAVVKEAAFAPVHGHFAFESPVTATGTPQRSTCR